MLTNGERTVVLSVTGGGNFVDNVDSGGATLQAASSGFGASAGLSTTGGFSAALLRVSANHYSLSADTPGLGSATISASTALPSGAPHSASGPWSVEVSLTLILTQTKTRITTGGGTGYRVAERLKAGATQTLTATWTFWDGSSSTQTVTFTGSATLALDDYCGRLSGNASAFASTGSATGSLTATLDTGGWGANWSVLTNSSTQTLTGGSRSASASAGSGEFSISCAATSTATAGSGGGGIDDEDDGREGAGGGGGTPGASAFSSASASGMPRYDVQVDVEPYIFDMMYGGTYKIATTQGISSAFPGAPTRTAPLYGPFTGSANFQDLTAGGFASINLFDIGGIDTQAGNRVNSLYWTFVSPSSTSSFAAIPHPDHPTADFCMVCGDRSAALEISHDGDWTIEDGSTTTPTGGEWVLLAGSGTISAGAGGITLTNTGSSRAYFRRGWARYTGPSSSETKTAGDKLVTTAFRHLRIAATSEDSTPLTVLLPGIYNASALGIQNLEGELYDPLGSIIGAKRWQYPVGPTGAIDLDLCNPDIWTLDDAEKPGVMHIDTPYLPASAGGVTGPPEGYSRADQSWTGTTNLPSGLPADNWASGAHNFSGVPQWSRMVFGVESGKSVTIASMTLLEPSEIKADCGDFGLRIWADGKIVYTANLNTSGSTPTIETVRANIDAVEHLSCTTSLNTESWVPSELAPSNAEESRNQRADALYWGNISTNLNVGAGATASLQLPLIGAVSWHPGARLGAVGTHYNTMLFTTMRVRFGGSFGGLVFRESRRIGDGSVSVASDASYAVDALGRWAAGSDRPRLRTTDTHVIAWDGWSQLAIHPNDTGPLGRGVRRWTSFKGGYPLLPYSGLSAHTSASGQTAWAGVRGGDILTGWAVDFATATWEERPTGFSGTRPHLRFDRSDASGRVYLLFEGGGGSVKLSWSDDGGRSWASAMSIWASGAGHPAGDVSGGGFLLAAARIAASGAIEVKAIDRLGNVLFTATALAGGAASDSIPVTWDYTAQRWYLLYIDAGGAMQRLQSADDGRTWS